MPNLPVHSNRTVKNDAIAIRLFLLLLPIKLEVSPPSGVFRTAVVACVQGEDNIQ